MNAWNFDDGDGSSSGGGGGGGSVLRSEIQPSKRDSGAGSFQAKKHAFFAAEDSSLPSEPPSSRRKQPSSGHRELVLDDDDDDLEEQERQQSRPDHTSSSSIQHNRARSGSKASELSSDAQRCEPDAGRSGAKVVETEIPGIIHTVLRSKGSESRTQMDSSSASHPASASPSSKKRVALADLSLDQTELFTYYLVREFLKLHVADDAVVGLFEKERPMQGKLDEKEAKKLFERVTGQRDASSRSRHVSSSPSSSSSTNEKSPRPLLEQFMAAWDESVHKRKCDRPSSSSRRSSGSSSSRQSEAKPESSSTEARKKTPEKVSPVSTRKKKPMLNVITTAEELDNVDALNNSDGGSDAEGQFNRLNHPGSTPKPQGSLAMTDVASSILGDPGSTPKARASDLKALGFDEDELNTPVPIENTSSAAAADTKLSTTSEADADISNLSEYAKRKRIAKKHSKHVSLGESGSTPTKEYIFFRETPPSFVTETVEDAVDVLEKLGLDPTFRQQAASLQERFVELQSSEVSKYKIGQEVQNLGAQRNVSGLVSKIFGSRQCGSSGPGTIVIDTCPDDADAVAPVSAAATP